MTITLTSDQQRTIQHAIEAGVVKSVENFIESALEALPQASFDPRKAEFAARRIRKIRKGVKLDLQGMSIREFSHVGHKY